MMKTIVTAIASAFIGASAVFFLLPATEAQTAKSIFKYPLTARLQRFEVVEGKEQRFNEWMNYLRAQRVAAVETLEGEKTYFEAVFSDKTDGKTYAFWMTFKGEGGRPVESSNYELDKKHLEFWNECIKKDSRKVYETEFYLTPNFLDKAVAGHQKLEK